MRVTNTIKDRYTFVSDYGENETFGGVSVIIVGDLHQLAAIIDSHYVEGTKVK